MAATLSIEIDDELAEFVDGQLAKGAYGSFDEMVDAALALLRRNMELVAIEAAIAESEESGEPQEFDFDRFLEEKRRKSTC